ncbi:unannotated protein [freshwater metagenome]|uniref:Unannotated protein n=1 Tax=freshwater metagenome TaxID=449393 RepID=A0A6J7S8P1_9ZZZZ|nr:hypothetical protein [Actinomycetota bacterium]MSW35725.1 hypothetical protein [Actinomycetota bacterium]
MSRPRRPRAAAVVGLLLGGLVLGLFSAVVLPAREEVHGVMIPWGAVLVLVGVGVCARAGAWLTATRRGAALVGCGWLVGALAIATVAPGGDVVLPDTMRTSIFLVGGALLAIIATAWPLPAGVVDLIEAQWGSDPAVDDGPGAPA